MKARAIIVADIAADSYKEIAEIEATIEKAVASVFKADPRIVWHGMEVKERRGDIPIDMAKMKWRSN